MFNTINFGESTTKVNINTPCTGIIQRSHPKSYFARFHTKSLLAEWVFSGYPRLQKETYRADKIAVLQVMVFGDNEMLIEYVYEKDLQEKV